MLLLLYEVENCFPAPSEQQRYKTLIILLENSKRDVDDSNGVFVSNVAYSSLPDDVSHVVAVLTA